jgi:putative protein kinase ArgK-like GTPase of G3E family
LLAAAFFTRITKIDVPGLGLSVEMGAKVAKVSAEAAEGDPERTEQIFTRIAPEVADYLRSNPNRYVVTGAPGTGKSTLVDRLATHLRQAKKTARINADFGMRRSG